MNHFEHAEDKIQQYLGLPISYVGKDRHTVFVDSLYWGHKQRLNRDSPKRNRSFPSYSWAGWTGVASFADYPEDKLQHKVYLAVDHRQDKGSHYSEMTLLGPTELVALLANSENNLGLTRHFHSNPHLVIDADVIQVQLQYFPGQPPTRRFANDEDVLPAFWIIDPEKDVDQRQIAPVTLSKRPLKHQSFFHTLQILSWDCLVVSSWKTTQWNAQNFLGYDTAYFLMLVQHHGDVTERIGVVNSWLCNPREQTKYTGRMRPFVKRQPKERRRIHLR